MTRLTDRREAQGADQDRRATARAARPVLGRGRDLRAARPVVRRSDLGRAVRSPTGFATSPGWSRSTTPSKPRRDAYLPHRPGEGGTERDFGRADRPDAPCWRSRERRWVRSGWRESEILCGSSCGCRDPSGPVPQDLSAIRVKGHTANRWPSRSWAAGRRTGVDQTIYHKNLERVVYVFAETAGRPPQSASSTSPSTGTPGRHARRPGWVNDAAATRRRIAATSRTAAASAGPCPRASGRFCRRGRVEDHDRRLPRSRAGLWCGDADDLHYARRPDRARSSSRWSSCWPSR